MCVWPGTQSYIPENSEEPEKVLVFQIGGGASLVHLNSQEISFFTEVFCDVKFRGSETVLCISDKGSVEPYIHSLFHPFEENAHLSAL